MCLGSLNWIVEHVFTSLMVQAKSICNHTILTVVSNMSRLSLEFTRSFEQTTDRSGNSPSFQLSPIKSCPVGNYAEMNPSTLTVNVKPCITKWGDNVASNLTWKSAGRIVNGREDLYGQKHPNLCLLRWRVLTNKHVDSNKTLGLYTAHRLRNISFSNAVRKIVFNNKLGGSQT